MEPNFCFIQQCFLVKCHDSPREKTLGLCADWHKHGACTKHQQLMLRFCPATCNFCGELIGYFYVLSRTLISRIGGGLNTENFLKCIKRRVEMSGKIGKGEEIGISKGEGASGIFFLQII